jgi:hypothetical protein
VLTPVFGEAATTSWPASRSLFTVFEPMSPLPPITTIFMPHPRTHDTRALRPLRCALCARRLQADIPQMPLAATREPAPQSIPGQMEPLSGGRSQPEKASEPRPTAGPGCSSAAGRSRRVVLASALAPSWFAPVRPPQRAALEGLRPLTRVGFGSRAVVPAVPRACRLCSGERLWARQRSVLARCTAPTRQRALDIIPMIA